MNGVEFVRSFFLKGSFYKCEKEGKTFFVRNFNDSRGVGGTSESSEAATTKIATTPSVRLSL